MTDQPAIHIVLKHTCLLGEGPVWDAEENIICWIDILNGELHQFSPVLKTHSIIAVKEMIGSFALCSNGDFIAALQNGFAFIDRTTGAINRIANPELHLPGNRFNDGKCDPAGRFWAGTMSLTETPLAGNVYLLDKDLVVTKKIEQVSISNGMAWSRNCQTFYYIDTPTYSIVAYDYNNITGEITNKKVVIQIPEREGFPDGMTIDEDGMLWIAHWNGWQVARWNPATGEKLYAIKIPVAKVTSCTFGGADLNDLYITTAKVDLTEMELKQQPLAGGIFVVPNCGFKGLPAVKFRI